MPTEKSIPREKTAFPVLTEVTIRYSDQDPMQHINNVAITAFLESGRTGLFDEIFQGRLPTRGMVLAGLTVDYLHEIKYPGVVHVGGRLKAFGERSLSTEFAIFQGDRCCVVSSSVNVFFNPETRKSTAPTSDIREAMARFLEKQNGV